MKLKTIFSMSCIFALVLSGSNKQTDNEQKINEVDYSDNPNIKIELEDGSKIMLELYPEYAPKTVDNFITLVNQGFYDGLTFHRIVDDFMAQGGDPNGNGSGGSSTNIVGEFSENGFSQNTLSHTKGVISMARSQQPNSASSQFFIMIADTYSYALDGKYAAFGKVIEGIEVIENLQTIERSYNSMGELAIPVNPVVMKKVSVVGDNQ